VPSDAGEVALDEAIDETAIECAADVRSVCASRPRPPLLELHAVTAQARAATAAGAIDFVSAMAVSSSGRR
jgi:hypothetical protein